MNNKTSKTNLTAAGQIRLLNSILNNQEEIAEPASTIEFYEEKMRSGQKLLPSELRKLWSSPQCRENYVEAQNRIEGKLTKVLVPKERRSETVFAFSKVPPEDVLEVLMTCKTNSSENVPLLFRRIGREFWSLDIDFSDAKLEEGTMIARILHNETVLIKGPIIENKFGESLSLSVSLANQLNDGFLTLEIRKSDE